MLDRTALKAGRRTCTGSTLLWSSPWHYCWTPPAARLHTRKKGAPQS